jgi:hypothetical protein
MNLVERFGASRSPIQEVVRYMQENRDMEQFVASDMKKENCQELKRFRRSIQKAIQNHAVC